jgi:hypothetical protein
MSPLPNVVINERHLHHRSRYGRRMDAENRFLAPFSRATFMSQVKMGKRKYRAEHVW